MKKKHHSIFSLAVDHLREALLLLVLPGLIPLAPAGAAGAGEPAAGSPAAGSPAAGEPEYLVTGRPPGRAGGRLVVALRAEPRTFNPVFAFDHPSRTVTRRLMATLTRLDRETQHTEPALARSWTVSDDGRRIAFELRRGIRFSDGHLFDADDVVFTFEVYLDEEIASNYRSNLMVGGEPIRVRKTGPHRVVLELAAPDAEGPGLVDAIAILPRHRLEQAYREGRFSEVWGTGTAGEEIVGLGPFRIKRFLPGERLELERNPHYWKVDREGARLPYLDELTFLLVPTEEAQVIRFRSGETHLIDRLSAKSFDLLIGEKNRGYLLQDLGPGINFHFLFFNLNDVDGKRMPEIARKQAWFRQQAFRRAVSTAIDRAGIVRLVFEGRATAIASHVTAGNKRWVDPGLRPPPRSLEKSRRLLRNGGFSWDREGRLLDAEAEPITFSIVVNSGNAEQMAMTTVIQEDLRQLGIGARVVPLEFRALVDRLLHTFEYEACVLGLSGYVDPNHFLAVWRSDGNSHLWRLTPGPVSVPWQAELDRLMAEQQTTLDHSARKALYDRVQAILAEQEPYILLASPNVLVGASRGLGGFTPSILDHPTLWNVDELYWLKDDSAAQR